MRGIDHEQPLEIEQIADTTTGPEITAGRFEQPAQLARRAIPIIGQRLAKNGYAARAVTFINHFVEILRAQLTRRLLDRPLDVFLGNAERPSFINRVPQPHVCGRVASAVARGHVDGPAELREKLPTLGIDQAFAVGDVG